MLLLDEPFGALDAQVRKELREWLRRLHDEMQVTTVLVTHDQDEALEIADQIVVINHGRVEQAGTPDALYDAPANDFVRRFLGDVTTLCGQAVRPHDIDLSRRPVRADAVEGTVSRVVRSGFAAHVTVLTELGEVVVVTTTRNHVERDGIEEGLPVWLSVPAQWGRQASSATVCASTASGNLPVASC